MGGGGGGRPVVREGSGRRRDRQNGQRRTDDASLPCCRRGGRTAFRRGATTRVATLGPAPPPRLRGTRGRGHGRRRAGGAAREPPGLCGPRPNRARGDDRRAGAAARRRAEVGPRPRAPYTILSGAGAIPRAAGPVYGGAVGARGARNRTVPPVVAPTGDRPRGGAGGGGGGPRGRPAALLQSLHRPGDPHGLGGGVARG